MRNVLAGLLGLTVASHAASTIMVEHLPADQATSGFQFTRVQRPVINDAARHASFTILSGQRDPNSGPLDTLHDGALPRDEDEPAANFFLRAGTDGGRLLVDLGTPTPVSQINSYSWHPGGRGPQVYTLYSADGQDTTFNPQTDPGTDPAAHGWTHLATVDTRADPTAPGGQYAVCIDIPTNTIPLVRYLLFDVTRTSDVDPFGHTFFSEIDVLSASLTELQFVETTSTAGGAPESITFHDGKYTVVLDTTETPDLADWVRDEIVPMVVDWYPRLVEMLPSDGFVAPSRFSIRMDPGMRGVAATSGTRIRCAAGWIRSNLEGEAKGAIFHEMVHVIQQYGGRGRDRGSRPPGWLVEGITDYIRWFLFEPESRGAEISQRNLDRARYDASYRITANFLNWVCARHGEDFIPKLNAAIREGRYSANLWVDLTGQSVQDLGAAWKTDLEKQVASTSATDPTVER